MKTIKGNQKELIKEYKNFCNDLKLIENYVASINCFAKAYIEKNIKQNGLFYNDFFKTIELDKTDKEIFTILYRKFINKNYMK